jgi:hypothetical protein
VSGLIATLFPLLPVSRSGEAVYCVALETRVTSPRPALPLSRTRDDTERTPLPLPRSEVISGQLTGNALLRNPAMG